MSTDIGRPGGAARPSYIRAGPAARAGWIPFGAITMIMLGAFQLIEGLAAVFSDGCYLVGREMKAGRSD